jgi:catechol 2,3-dioxygenase-like lactoylglutathione lyase family enzyme
MAKLRHIALSVPDNDRAAAFYEKVFGMERVGREEDEKIGSVIYLSDGVVNLALLCYKPGAVAAGTTSVAPIGPNHFGFIVDDLEKTQSDIEAAGGKFFFKLGDSDRVNFELKFKDPDGIVFDLSQKGWIGTSKDR